MWWKGRLAIKSVALFGQLTSISGTSERAQVDAAVVGGLSGYESAEGDYAV